MKLVKDEYIKNNIFKNRKNKSIIISGIIVLISLIFIGIVSIYQTNKGNNIDFKDVKKKNIEYCKKNIEKIDITDIYKNIDCNKEKILISNKIIENLLIEEKKIDSDKLLYLNNYDKIIISFLNNFKFKMTSVYFVLFIIPLAFFYKKRFYLTIISYSLILINYLYSLPLIFLTPFFSFIYLLYSFSLIKNDDVVKSEFLESIFNKIIPIYIISFFLYALVYYQYISDYGHVFKGTAFLFSILFNLLFIIFIDIKLFYIVSKYNDFFLKNKLTIYLFLCFGSFLVLTFIGNPLREMEKDFINISIILICAFIFIIYLGKKLKIYDENKNKNNRYNIFQNYSYLVFLFENKRDLFEIKIVLNEIDQYFKILNKNLNKNNIQMLTSFKKILKKDIYKQVNEYRTDNHLFILSYVLLVNINHSLKIESINKYDIDLKKEDFNIIFENYKLNDFKYSISNIIVDLGYNEYNSFELLNWDKYSINNSQIAFYLFPYFVKKMEINNDITAIEEYIESNGIILDNVLFKDIDKIKAHFKKCKIAFNEQKIKRILKLK